MACTLEMKGIGKCYPGIVALEGVDLAIESGQVHALIGENGAGKSTLMRILAGAEQRDSGEIHMDGRRVRIETPQQAMNLGIAVIYQELSLVPHLSAAENIFLGREPRGRLPGFIDYPRLHDQAQALLDGFGARVDARAAV
jgi:ABC-type sugar transport system ATPase subunit